MFTRSSRFGPIIHDPEITRVASNHTYSEDYIIIKRKTSSKSLADRYRTAEYIH